MSIKNFGSQLLEKTKEKKVYLSTFDTTMSQDRSTGVVWWFSDQKGFEFITPNKGSEDLFFHQSSIKSHGFRSLGEGEKVEFQIGLGEDGRTKVMEVIGPDGSFVQGETTTVVAKAIGVVGSGAGGEVIGVVMVVVWLVTNMVIMET